MTLWIGLGVIQYTSLEIAEPKRESYMTPCGPEESLQYAGIQEVGIWFKKRRVYPTGPTEIYDTKVNATFSSPCYQQYVTSTNQIKYIGLDRGSDPDETFNSGCGVGSWGFDYEPEMISSGEEEPSDLNWKARCVLMYSEKVFLDERYLWVIYLIFLLL